MMNKKWFLYVPIACAGLALFVGCEKADQAVKTFEKARTIKEALEKKTKDFRAEVERRGKELQDQGKKAIPEPPGKPPAEEKKSPEKQKEAKEKDRMTVRTSAERSPGNK